TQLLLLFDTCYSGGGVMSAIGAAGSVFTFAPPEGQRVWIGVVASALEYEEAKDGAFAARFLKLLQVGPSDPALRGWSAQNEEVTGEDIIQALQSEWDEREQQLLAVRLGRVAPMLGFPNPLHDPAAPEQVVEHLLVAARGGEP